MKALEPWEDKEVWRMIASGFAKYDQHAAIVGGFNTFRGRSAVADIAKVMGVSEYSN